MSRLNLLAHSHHLRITPQIMAPTCLSSTPPLARPHYGTVVQSTLCPGGSFLPQVPRTFCSGFPSFHRNPTAPGTGVGKVQVDLWEQEEVGSLQGSQERTGSRQQSALLHPRPSCRKSHHRQPGGGERLSEAGPGGSCAANLRVLSHSYQGWCRKQEGNPSSLLAHNPKAPTGWKIYHCGARCGSGVNWPREGSLPSSLGSSLAPKSCVPQHWAILPS